MVIYLNFSLFGVCLFLELGVVDVWVVNVYEMLVKLRFIYF